MQERVHSAEAGQESDGVVVAGRPVEEQGGAKDQSTAHKTEERVCKRCSTLQDSRDWRFRFARGRGHLSFRATEPSSPPVQLKLPPKVSGMEPPQAEPALL
jgi:hypothetical protein